MIHLEVKFFPEILVGGAITHFYGLVFVCFQVSAGAGFPHIHTAGCLQAVSCYGDARTLASGSTILRTCTSINVYVAAFL